MKAIFLLLAVTSTAFAQQVSGPDEKASAADITRGRVGGDASRTSTSVRIEGNANQGAGANTLSGATSETLRIDATAAAREAAAATGTTALTVTGATTTRPVENSDGTGDDAVIQPKAPGTTSPAAGATDTGPGAER